VSEPFVALVVYQTTAEAQSRQAETLTRALDWMRDVPGMVRAQVLVSEDGENIVTLTRWTDRDSFERYRLGEVGRAAASLAVDAHPKAFWLRVHGDSDPETR
jgi:heme-degrading monooxygenase HmoA